MKVGRNDFCPCGSGKKYKKCCLNKENNSMNVLNNLFAYHDNYIHTKEVKNKELNDKLLYTYDNKNNMSSKEVIDNYFDVMNYILDYAKENNIRNVEVLDNENLISEFIGNVIDDLQMELDNVFKDEYDFNIIFDYLDRLICTLDLDYNTYEWAMRCKTHNLFKIGNYELGEQVMLDLIEEKHNSIYPYVQLVDDFEMIKDMEKAKYYYELGLKYKDYNDYEVLEEREDYFD